MSQSMLEKLITVQPQTMKIPRKNITVITKTRKFSNESVHCPNYGCGTEFFGFELGSEDEDHYFEMVVQANSKEKGDFGWVRLKIREYSRPLFWPFEGAIFISVRDAAGLQRFPQSFTVNTLFEEYSCLNPESDTWRSINYIKRETLLGDPEELLPNDTLTLEIEICPYNALQLNIKFYSDTIQPVVSNSLKVAKTNGETSACYLLLDSPLVEILSKESLFFQRLLENKMLDSNPGRMKISGLEYETFKKITELLLCDFYFIIKHIRDIFDMYIVADKYDIPFVTETCISFLKLCLPNMSSVDLPNLFNPYVDETRAAVLEKLKTRICSEVTRENTNNIVPEETLKGSGWIFKGHKFHDAYEEYGLLFVNPYKSTSHMYK